MFEIHKANTSILSEFLHIKPEDARIIYTPGGTYSIIEAITTFARYKWAENVLDPIFLLSEYRHFAFDKACDFVNAKMVIVPTDPKTKKINLLELRKRINWYGRKNIAGIVVNAPNFPNGAMDDIEGAGQIALANNIPLHVDACLGGFVNMFNNEVKFLLQLNVFQEMLSVSQHAPVWW